MANRLNPLRKLDDLRFGQTGITLIELLVVVVVVGILATIAVQSYQDYVRSANRAEAKAILLETAQFLERNYTAANRYDQDAAGNATKLPFSTSPKSGGGPARYIIDVTYGSAPAQTYTLRATRNGIMVGDKCGDFTLTQAGVQALINNTATVAECWER